MATDLERLVVSLEARIDSFDKAMKRANDLHAKNTGEIDKRTAALKDSVSRQFGDLGEAASRVFGGMVKGAIAAATFAELSKQIGASVEDMKKLEDAAKRLQTTTDAVQKTRFAGQKLGGLDAGTVDTGLTAIADKANKEFRDGEGELSKLLDANGLKLTDRAGKLKSINDLLMDAALLISNAATEADKVDIAKLFGLTEQWVKALEGGPNALRQGQAEATAVGAVIDKELVQRAADFDKIWASSWNNFKVYAKSATVEAAGYLRGVAAAMNPWSSDIEALQRNLDVARKAKADLGSGSEPGPLATLLGLSGDTFVDKGVKDAEEKLDRALQKLKDHGLQTVKQMTVDAAKEADKATGKYDPAFGNLDYAKKQFSLPNGQQHTTVPKTEKSGGSSGAEAQNDFDREERSAEKRIRNLNAEAEAIGKTAYEAAYAEQQYRLMDAAKNAGVETDPKVIASIERLSAAYAEAKVKVESAKQAFAKSQELQGFAGNQLIGILQGATKGMEGLRQATLRFVDALIEAVLQAALLGKGPLAGIFGTMGAGGNYGGLVGAAFGTSGVSGSSGMPMVLPSAFKIGGVVGQGGQATHAVPLSAFARAPRFDVGGMVGSAGNFLKGLGAGARPVIAHDGEIILNAAQQKALGGAMKGGQQIIQFAHNPTFQIPQMPNGITLPQLLSYLQRYDQQLQRKLPAMLRKSTQRYG